MNNSGDNRKSTMADRAFAEQIYVNILCKNVTYIQVVNNLLFYISGAVLWIFSILDGKGITILFLGALTSSFLPLDFVYT